MFTQGVAGVEGTIHRGDRVLSINGTSLSGISHAQALSCLHQTRLPKQALVIIQKGKNTEPTSPRQELPLQTGICPTPGHRDSIREHKTSEYLESLSLSQQKINPLSVFNLLAWIVTMDCIPFFVPYWLLGVF